MSNYYRNILIQKNGFVCINKSSFDFDDKNFEKYLTYNCLMDKDVTLRDIMISVDKYKNLKNFINNYSLGNINIDDFHSYLYYKKESINKKNKIDKLVVSWRFCIEKKSFDFYIDFFGIENGKKCGIVFIFKDILDIPVEIENEGLFINYKKNIKLNYNINLLEFLNSIYFEISFYGPPKNLNKISNKKN